MTEPTEVRSAALDGIRAMTPLILPAIPFALVVGVLINDSEMNNLVGWLSGVIVFAGSAQFVALSEVIAGGGVIVTVLAVWVINARHVIYSAALADRFRDTTSGWKWLASYVLTDQVFAVVEPLEERSLQYRQTFFLSAGFLAWSVWQLATLAGILAGDFIPESWSLLFAVPLMFLGLMVLAIRDSPGLIAAAVGGVTAILGTDMPQGTGLLLGAFLGIAAGGLAEYWMEPKEGQAVDA